MTKYSMEIIFDTVTQFNKLKLAVSDCESKEKAMEDMKKFISLYPEVMKKSVNKEILELVGLDK